MSYHNTNQLSGIALSRAIKKATSQENIVLLFFKAYPHRSYAPHEIRNLLEMELSNAPLTSIRRAMSNLKNNGRLIKTDEMIDGPYGSPVHRYRLNINKKPIQPSLF